MKRGEMVGWVDGMVGSSENYREARYLDVCKGIRYRVGGKCLSTFIMSELEILGGIQKYLNMLRDGIGGS